LYAAAALFFTTSVLQGFRAHSGQGYGKLFTRENGILVTIETRRELEPGQYINIRIPSLSRSQSHPFVVTCWTGHGQKKLELFIQPLHGLTRKLYSLVEREGARIPLGPVSFTGPHGTPVKVASYQYLLLFASDCGIFALLAILERLLYGINSGEARAQHVNVFWEVNTRGK
jgi:NAD(P)H-flavin reductase